MNLSLFEQSLLDALRALPPQNAYANAERKAIIRGFQLFIDHRVGSIRWEEGAILVVDMRARAANLIDLIPVSVRVFLENLDVRAVCSCGRSELHERCEHVVCALVTLLHLVKPNVFRMTRQSPEYRARLEAGLLKGSPQPSPQDAEAAKPGKRLEGPSGRGLRHFRVVTEADGGRLRAFVEMNGKRVDEGADFRTVPWEIAYLVRSGYQHDMSYALSVFLKRTENLYPMFFKEGPHRHEIEWIGERSCPTWTEFDARGDRIVARKACSLDEEGESDWTVIGSFALNSSRTAMTRISPKTGWQCWDMIRSLIAKDAGGPVEMSGPEISMPVDVYRSLRIILPKSGEKQALDKTRCMVEGKQVVVPLTEATGYTLVISRSVGKEREFLIEPICWSGSFPFSPSDRIVDFARSIENGPISTSLRTKKRRPVLYDALFGALEAPTRVSAAEALKETASERVFGRRNTALEARRLVKQSIDAFNAEEVHFLFTDHGWKMTRVDKKREKMLFLVPFAAFGPDLFERVPERAGAMVVSEDLLLEHLPSLYALAAEAGVPLSFGDYPVESVSWEVELDVASGSIDWFEIRPEIRCNGRAIPRNLWEQALARKGVLVHDGTVQILDEKSIRALYAFSRLWEGTAGRKGARTIASIPRLRIIDLFLLRKAGVAVKLSDEDEALIMRLVRFARIEERTLAPSLRANLREYQMEGFYWLAFLYEHGFGACLADDMGLGKTVQAISLLAAIKEGLASNKTALSGSTAACPFLIVVPPSLIFNWEQEIERFCPLLKVYVYRGKERSISPSGHDVILTSYGLVRRDIDKFKETTFDVIVFDEAQAIKNIFADTTGAVRQLKGRFKLALTGTPVENHVGEYFSIMDLVLPGLLGEYRQFQGKKREDLSTLLPLLRERTKPFMLRRTKEHILKELPPKVEHDVYLELTDEQKRFYNRTIQEVRATIDAAYRGKTASQARIIALTAIMRLRQICLTPQLLLPELRASSPKVEFLKEKLDELCRESHSALVFSQFTSFLDVVEADLRAKGFPVHRLDGSTPVARRKDVVEAFQGSADPSVFLLSLKAGGQGLNLTRATYVFHLDPWWNPAVENQASDRSHRIGQTRKVHVTRLLMRHTVEEKMMTLKHQKLALYKALMDAPEHGSGRAVTREDFDFLLG